MLVCQLSLPSLPTLVYHTLPTRPRASKDLKWSVDESTVGVSATEGREKNVPKGGSYEGMPMVHLGGLVVVMFRGLRNVFGRERAVFQPRPMECRA